MAYPVVYGKTKLSSAVGGESILDAGDLNYAVNRILLTDANASMELPPVMSSFYAVSRTGSPSGLLPSTMTIPDAWFNSELGQHDNRNTGWRIRVHFAGSGSLVVELNTTGNVIMLPDDLIDFIYAPALVGNGLVVNGDSNILPVSEFIVHFIHNRTVI